MVDSDITTLSISEDIMKKVFTGFVVCCFMLGGAVPVFSAEKRGTATEAEMMVKKAVLYIKANGRERAFAEISNPKGRFVDRDLYVVAYDMNGVCLAHGFNQKMVGKSLIDLKDPDGRAFVKERCELGKTKDCFWQTYRFVNPTTKQIENKAMYMQKTGNILVGCGIYK